MRLLETIGAQAVTRLANAHRRDHRAP